MAHKYRLKFTKVEKMRFIGHLDLLKLFQRAIKRADLPVSYSNGFNPHQIISFALPLSLGMGSLGEYTDVEFENIVDEAEVMTRLNAVMPLGIEIVKCRRLEPGEKNSAALTEGAIYTITLSIERATQLTIKELLEKTMNQTEILVQKKTKSGMKEVDIRPYIYEAADISDEQESKIQIKIAAGSINNLKAELFVEYLYSVMGVEFNPYKIKYIREDLLKKANEQFVSLY